jgi:hypothetical protein
VGQPVFRGASAKNNPALTSGAQKISCKLPPKTARNILKKSLMLLPDPWVRSLLLLTPFWQKRGSDSKSSCLQAVFLGLGLTPRLVGLGFSLVV